MGKTQMCFYHSENNCDCYNQVGLYCVCHEIIHIKYSKPNQLTHFAPFKCDLHNRVNELKNLI